MLVAGAFVVAAVGVVQESALSTASAATVPTAPTVTSTTAVPGGALVYFTPPASNGGAPITNYEFCDWLDCATFAPLSPPDTTSPIYVPMIGAPDSGYVKIRAVNSVGAGAPSNLLVAVPVLPPYPWAPTGLVAKAGSQSATISFTPGSDNGHQVSNYQYSLDGGAWKALSPADASSPVTVTGLTNGTTYRIRLRGVNAFGGGLASGSVSVTPSPQPPAAPTRVAASPRNGAASVALLAGAANGAAITNYQYSLNGGAWRALSPADAVSPVRIPGLVNGVRYSIRLRAVNAKGVSAASPAVDVRPSATPVVPGAPTFVTAKPGTNGRSATVSFWAGSDGGAAITTYQYSLNGGAWRGLSPADAASPITITGLTPGVAYGVRVRAVNLKGAGAASASVSVKMYGVPSAPTTVRLKPADGGLFVSFGAPVSNGGRPITAYQYSLNGEPWGALSMVSSPNPALIVGLISGLTNGGLYSVRVRALNDVGAGAPGFPPDTGVPGTPPESPTNIVATFADGGAILDFTPGAPGAVPTDSYMYSLDGGSSWTGAAPISETRVGIRDLVNGQTYSVLLSAWNQFGMGPASDPVVGTPYAAPSSPVLSSVVAGADRITIGFAAPADDGGKPISNYAYSLDDGATWTEMSPATTASPLVVDGLAFGRTVTVRVAAVNAIGRGAASVASAVARVAAPSAPLNVVAATGTPVISFFDPLDGFRPVYVYPGIASWTAPVATGGSPITAYFADWYNPQTGQRITGCTTPPNVLSCQSEINFSKGTATWLIVTATNGNGLIGVGSPHLSWAP